jgi:hypothetical protein
LNRSAKPDVEASAKCFFPPCPVGLTHAYGVFYAPIGWLLKGKSSRQIGGEIFGAHLLGDGRRNAAQGEEDRDPVSVMGEADAVGGVEPDPQRGRVAGDGAGEDGLDRKGFIRIGLRSNPDDAARFVEEEEEIVSCGEERGLAGADGVRGEWPDER